MFFKKNTDSKKQKNSFEKKIDTQNVLNEDDADQDEAFDLRDSDDEEDGIIERRKIDVPCPKCSGTSDHYIIKNDEGETLLECRTCESISMTGPMTTDPRLRELLGLPIVKW
jgi:DNA-directed RNA polymerase subunit M/transcription elongation factor TFIIS